MIIVKGDKIKQVKEIMGFNKVGEVFEVLGVEDGVVSFRASFGQGVMSYNECEKYFEKVGEEQWSGWVTDGLEEFRIKGKVIQYRERNTNISVFSKCLPEDEFNLLTGLELCRDKLKFKKMKIELEKLKNQLSKY